MDDETPEALLTPTEVNTVTGMDAYRLGDGVKVWVRQFTAPWCRNCKIYAQELAEKLRDVDPASVTGQAAGVTLAGSRAGCRTAMQPESPCTPTRMPTRVFLSSHQDYFGAIFRTLE